MSENGLLALRRLFHEGSRGGFILVSGADSWAPFFVRWLFRAIRVMPIIQEKARSEAYVRSSGLQWTILWPGFLTNFRMRAEPVLLPLTGLAPGLTTRQRWRMWPSAVFNRRTPSTRCS